MLESWGPSQEEQWEMVEAGIPEGNLGFFEYTPKNKAIFLS